MRKLLLLITTLLCALLMVACTGEGQDTGISDGAEDINPIAGVVLPEFSAMDLDGNTVTQEIFAENKITMINMWGTFCGPCIDEMPDLQKLYINYQDKGLLLVGLIDDPDNAADAIDLVSQAGSSYPQLLPDTVLREQIMDKFDSVPSTVFVDSSGKVIGPVLVGKRSYEEYAAVIEELLTDQ